MRHVSIDSLTPGMTTGVNIFAPGDTRSIPLVARGVTITEALQDRLRRAGVESVPVDDEFSEGIEPASPITDEVRNQSVAVVKDTFSKLRSNENVLSHEQLDQVETTMNAILAEIMSRRNLLVCLSDLNVFGGARMQHAVNVCVLGCNVGRAYFNEHGWRDFRGQRRDDGIPDRLQKLGVGLLLQDIGALGIPEHIWEKNGILSASDRAIMQQHPLLALEMLEGSDISPLTKVTIAQHHERYDGSGYPRGIRGSDLHDHGQIAAIAEAYVSLIDGVQAGHKPFPSNKAYETIIRASGKLFHPDVVTAFQAAVAPFGAGEAVKLSDGRCGLVVENHHDDPTSPLVRVTHGADGKALPSFEEIDLRLAASPRIVEALDGLPSDAPRTAASSRS